MQKLRAELRIIATERGDQAEPEARGRVIDQFVDELEQLFTPQGLATFTAEEIRGVFVHYCRTLIEELGYARPSLEQLIMARFVATRCTDPGREVVQPSVSQKVVSLH